MNACKKTRPPSARPRGALARAALACLLALGLIPAMPGKAVAAANIDRVDEADFEPLGYASSIDFAAVEAESGFREVADVSAYASANADVRDQLAGPGFQAAIDGAPGGGAKPSLRYTGGRYGEWDIDAVVTLEDWTYLEPTGGWDAWWELGDGGFDPARFQPGVYVSKAYDAYGETDRIRNFNFYSVGLADLEVSVKWVFRGTDTPVPLLGHMTCIDLDWGQSFSFDGCINGARIVADNDHLDVVGTKAVSANEGLHEDAIAYPDEYRKGLVAAYYNTDPDKHGLLNTPAFLQFGTSWKGAEGTCQSFFAMTNEFLTVPNPDDDSDVGKTEVVKSADKTEGVSVGDRVEFTVDMQAHEWGVNCRRGWHYTSLDIVDRLPAEMRYVDGSGYLADEGGNRIEGAGTVVYEGDNEAGEENTVRFEFDRAYLENMKLEGQHYRLVFEAELTEYPADGALEVRNDAYALVNSKGKMPSNPVDVSLVPPAFSVDKTADRYEYEVGDVIAYTVVYRQTEKNAQSRETVISDDLPEGLELIAESVKATGIADMPEPSIDGNRWSYSFDKLNYGDTVTVTYQARATSHGNGTEAVNNASIHANNAMDADDPAEIWTNTASLAVAKKADKYEGYVGASDVDPGYFEYTVDVANAKEGTVANDVVVVDDSLPEGMKVGRNNDGSMMAEVYEDGQKVDMAWKGAEASGSFKPVPYPVGAEDDVHGQTQETEVGWFLEPAGSGWKLSVDHLAHGREVKVVYRAYPEDAVAGWEVDNEAEAGAGNSDGGSATETVWVNQPRFAVSKKASNDRFQVGDYVGYHVKAVNTVPGTLARNVVISDLAHTEGVELDRGSIRVYDSRGNDITGTCDVEYKHGPQGGEAFIVETHRDLVAASTADVAGLYDKLLASATEDEFDAALEELKKAVEDGGGADHESAAELVGSYPTWSDGKVTWKGGSNPIGVSPGSPRPGSESCETELTVEYRIKINDDKLAGHTVGNTAHVVSDEPNTGTTDDSVVDVKGAKLDVEKSSDKPVYQVGETARYTLTVEQTREAEGAVAENVVVSDRLAEPVLGRIVEGSVSAEGPDGPIEAEPSYEKAEDGAIVGFSLETGASLSEGERIVVRYDVEMTTAGESQENAVQAEADGAVGDSDKHEVAVEVDVAVEVEFAKSADRAEAAVGETVAYTLTATVAKGPAENVVVTDRSLPEGVPVDFSTVVATVNGSVVEAAPAVEGNGFSIALGDLAEGDSAAIAYAATVEDPALAGKTVDNTATLESDSLEGPLQDTASVAVPAAGDPAPEPGPEPGPSLDKSADKAEVEPGGTVGYTVKATAGEDLAGAVLVDTPDDGVAIDVSSVAVTVDGKAADAEAFVEGGALTVRLGDVAAGSEVVVTYEAAVDAGCAPGDVLRNVALLESDGSEPMRDEASVEVASPENPMKGIDKTGDQLRAWWDSNGAALLASIALAAAAVALMARRQRD